MRFCTFLYLCILFLTLSLAHPLNASTQDFNVKKANQEFDKINLQLSIQNLDLNNLQTAVVTLTHLTTQADQCVEDVQKKLNNTELLIKQDGISTDNKNQGADLVYLNNQMKSLGDEQAQCRLFAIRAREAIDAYKTAIAELKQEEAFTRGMPIWTVIQEAFDAPAETKFDDTISNQIPEALPPLSFWLMVCPFALLGSTVLLYRIKKSRFTSHYLRFKTLRMSHVLILSAFMITGTLFADLLFFYQDLGSSKLPLFLSGILFFYFTSMAGLIGLFKIKKVRTFFYWYSLDTRFLQSCSIALLSFYTAIMISKLFANLFNTNSPVWQLYQSIFILVVLSTTAYYFHRFFRIHRHISTIKRYYKLVMRLSMTILIICGLINVLGYYTLAQHLTLSGFTTLIIILITLLITQGINKFYIVLSQEPYKTNIIQYLGYRLDQGFTEILILKTTIQIIIIAISVYWIGQSWGFATDFIESMYDQILHGVHVVNFIIYPTRMIAGLMVFCVLCLIFRAISTSISNHQQFESEEETQVAVASILSYIGFSLALISGLLVAGFDFTGLAIIAGALSVGIGLGLQSIVNNFVSGIILLIEKPIRPGDRINVDGVEGFVKKIRVRSTQILTPSREDIIIPNSDLITRRVTNYMLSDKYCRINIELGVSYNSNTHLVRDVLLDIANHHEEIIKTGRNKPVVIFHSFGNDSLIFQLVCLIKDVNKKSLIQSELNYAIEEAFREHRIEMPYPQREIHIKLSELESLITQVKALRPSE